MSNEEQLWEDFAPYVVQPRQPNDLGARRAIQISALIRNELNTEHVQVQLRGEHAPGPEYGSCSRFFVFFDEEWQPIDGGSENRRFSIGLAVSERGPFVTAHGSAWHLHRQPWEGGLTELVPKSSDEASARAEMLALKVAKEFDLKYVDANWLRQFKLNAKELPWEDVLASLDVDTYEPTALSILFNEEL